MSNFPKTLTSSEGGLSGHPSCFPGMNRFKDDEIFRCPLWEFTKNRLVGKPKGMLLLQDWGDGDETFNDAITILEDCANGKLNEADRTLRNLFDKKVNSGLNIANGDIIATNAVWGLRDNKGKCGYLGAKTHKAAFANWGAMVNKVASCVNDENFRLYVAGSWAVFGKDNSSIDLKQYLTNWQHWVSQGYGKVDEKIGISEKSLGKVVYLYHPCMWKVKRGIYKKSAH